jgi:hypothetical protein
VVVSSVASRLVVGTTFVLFGVVGFIPALATHFHVTRMAFHSLHLEAELLGVFRVSVSHNGLGLFSGMPAAPAPRRIPARFRGAPLLQNRSTALA